MSCLDVQGFVTAADVDAAHIARHDPARAIAECEAKRALIAEHEGFRWRDEGCHACCDRPCRILRKLAAVYADHPDYRAEWRP